MTRKEQIEKFKADRMLGGGTGRKMVATRNEFLAYAFIRGRHYQQAERRTRPYEEKGFHPGMAAYGLAWVVREHFPVPDPVPVPVPAGIDEDPPAARKYPWPEVDYAGLVKQLEGWLREVAPDQAEILLREERSRAQAKASKAERAAEWRRRRED